MHKNTCTHMHMTTHKGINGARKDERLERNKVNTEGRRKIDECVKEDGDTHTLSLLNLSHTALSLPLYSQQQSCSFSSNGLGAQMSGSIEISSGSESDLQSAVANVGPLSVAVDGSNNAFRVSKSEREPWSKSMLTKSYFMHNMLTNRVFTLNKLVHFQL